MDLRCDNRLVNILAIALQFLHLHQEVNGRILLRIRSAVLLEHLLDSRQQQCQLNFFLVQASGQYSVLDDDEALHETVFQTLLEVLSVQVLVQIFGYSVKETVLHIGRIRLEEVLLDERFVAEDRVLNRILTLNFVEG